MIARQEGAHGWGLLWPRLFFCFLLKILLDLFMKSSDDVGMRTTLPDRITVSLSDHQKKTILALMDENDKGMIQRWFDRALMQLKEMNLQKKAS